MNVNDVRASYKIKEKLGKGSFAMVRRATHLVSKKDVALKIFYKPKMSKEDLKNVIYETQVLSQLNHSNILGLIDIFECQEYGFIYIVLECM